MVQKAKLDVLENLPDVEITDVNIQTEVQVEPPPFPGKKWALNKLFLIAMPVVIVVLVIIGVLWFYLTRTDTVATKLTSGTPAAMIENKKSEDVEKINKQTASEPVKTNKAYFKDFIIDLKDKTGKSKILMCDVALDVRGEEDIAHLENRTDIRNLIYSTVTEKNALALRSIEERKQLKKELLQEMNKLLGEGVVKDLYFTNYVIM